MSFGKIRFFVATVAIFGFGARGQNPPAALIVNFNQTNGGGPYTAMTLGVDGNLYGTVSSGGISSAGAIFELTSNNAFSLVADFAGTNGSFPCAKLLRATNDNLYGVTYGGGTNGEGSIFEFTTNHQLISLCSFAGTNGFFPWGGLIQASNGNFYGTTSSGGIGFSNGFGGNGTIFMMTPQGVVTNLYEFTGGPDGATPYGTLLQGTNGNLYGTTYYGGSGSGGIFEWKLDPGFVSVLNFNGDNGANPAAGLILGRHGVMYGTAATGGLHEDGEFYKLDYFGNLTPLHVFAGPDGAVPYGPIICCDCCYYGTTYSGGLYDSGSIYRIEIGTNPIPRFDSIYSFRDQIDGGYPEGGVTVFHRNIFATTIESSPGYGSLIELVEPPRLTHVSLLGGIFSASTSELQPGWTYQPQYSWTALPGTWSDWGPPVTATSRKQTFSGSVSGPEGFLRLNFTPPGLIPPPPPPP
jgi:uncharacterized repeat protein (TIGR03803 family)